MKLPISFFFSSSSFGLRLTLVWPLPVTLLLQFLLLGGCDRVDSAQDTGSTEVVLLFDRTDPMLLTPDYAAIEQLYGFEDHPEGEAIFRAGTISDKKLNTSYEAHLPSGRYSEAHNEDDDISFRNTAIRAFNGRLKAILAELKDTGSTAPSFDHSDCMSAIAGSLDGLNRSKAARRVLLLYTDLAENSTLNLCAAQGSHPLELKDTTVIAKRLQELAALPTNLSGIEVHLLYRPRSREDDQRYDVLSRVYRNLLESRGAHVSVSASNDINQL